MYMAASLGTPFPFCCCCVGAYCFFKYNRQMWCVSCVFLGSNSSFISYLVREISEFSQVNSSVNIAITYSFFKIQWFNRVYLIGLYNLTDAKEPLKHFFIYYCDADYVLFPYSCSCIMKLSYLNLLKDLFCIYTWLIYLLAMKKFLELLSILPNFVVFVIVILHLIFDT